MSVGLRTYENPNGTVPEIEAFNMQAGLVESEECARLATEVNEGVCAQIPKELGTTGNFGGTESTAKCLYTWYGRNDYPENKSLGISENSIGHTGPEYRKNSSLTNYARTMASLQDIEIPLHRKYAIAAMISEYFVPSSAIYTSHFLKKFSYDDRTGSVTAVYNRDPRPATLDPNREDEYNRLHAAYFSPLPKITFWEQIKGLFRREKTSPALPAPLPKFYDYCSFVPEEGPYTHEFSPEDIDSYDIAEILKNEFNVNLTEDPNRLLELAMRSRLLEVSCSKEDINAGNHYVIRLANSPRILTRDLK
jgi:hypothetical protein